MAMLERRQGSLQLAEPLRLTDPWEREASLRLRAGDQAVIAEYDQHGRILAGSREQMLDECYRRWLADYLQGNDSVMIAAARGRSAPGSGSRGARAAQLPPSGSVRMTALPDRLSKHVLAGSPQPRRCDNGPKKASLKRRTHTQQCNAGLIDCLSCPLECSERKCLHHDVRRSIRKTSSANLGRLRRRMLNQLPTVYVRD